MRKYHLLFRLDQGGNNLLLYDERYSLHKLSTTLKLFQWLTLGAVRGAETTSARCPEEGNRTNHTQRAAGSRICERN